MLGLLWLHVPAILVIGKEKQENVPEFKASIGKKKKKNKPSMKEMLWVQTPTPQEIVKIKHLYLKKKKPGELIEWYKIKNVCNLYIFNS